MLERVADGVLIHPSAFMQTNTVVVEGPDGVLLVDPGISSDEMAGIASDLRASGRPVAAGFSTHPHWDHLLWHAGLGQGPRYGTARGAAAIRARMSDLGWQERAAGMIPSDAGDVPLDELFGLITELPADATRLPWDGQGIRIIEHQAHAPGHAALLIEDPGVLVAGDMLSDVLVPILDLGGGADPIEDYLTALDLLEDAAGDVDVVVPGHGSVGGAGQVRARIDRDREYLHAVRDGEDPSDSRIGPSATPGWEWVSDLHAGQLERLRQRR
ncbi:MBL fold metallo-hydrolase [Microbacterium deminutum]|uniref:MBL fold metallo-hydrolase n=1 Tax=Microbacterium deminutum TaxID=344164 RepID=A0ABN2QDW6_9MICO